MAQVVLGFLAASHFSSDISDRMTSLDKSKESQKFRIIRISLSFFWTICLGLSVNAFLKRNFTANISHYYDFIPIVGFAFLRTYQKEMNGFHMGFDRAFEDFLSLSLILGNTISALESPLTKPLPKQGQTPESSYFLFASLLGILDRVLKASLAVANEFRGTQKSLVELDKMISDSKQTNKMQKFVEELIEPSEESFYLGRENEIEEVLDMIFRVYPCSNEFKLAM